MLRVHSCFSFSEMNVNIRSIGCFVKHQVCLLPEILKSNFRVKVGYPNLCNMYSILISNKITRGSLSLTVHSPDFNAVSLHQFVATQ